MEPTPLNDVIKIRLPHRTHPPSKTAVTSAMLMVAILTLLGAIEATKSIPAAIAISAVVFLFGLWLFPVLFYWKTHQLAVPTELVADATKVTGYLQWPPTWPHSFLELPITISWRDVRAVGIRAVPYIYAPSNTQLELTLKNGRSRTLRLPRLTDAEYSDFVTALRAIASGSGINFAIEPPIGPAKY